MTDANKKHELPPNGFMFVNINDCYEINIPKRLHEAFNLVANRKVSGVELWLNGVKVTIEHEEVV